MPGVGGRPKGSKNANRRALASRLAERFPEWDPVVQMAEVANDESLPLDTRFMACKEVAGYLTPKLKAVEHYGSMMFTVELSGDAKDLV